MCGIAGFFGGPPSAHFAEHALRCLASRGPDGSGVWKSADGGVALVHTRLAILDLSDAGHQPMEHFEEKLNGAERQGQELFATCSTGGPPEGGIKSEKLKAETREGTGNAGQETDSSYQPSTLNSQPSSSHQLSPILVFNGEIYNYRELRRELEASGETFVSDGDTEVLLRLLVREGAACLPKLAGMFAFAFWNPATGEGLLARDPLGIKPLYYRLGDGSLAFASESQVLHLDGDSLDPAALRDYFLWGSVPDPQTLYLSTRQLPAGHLLEWKGGKHSIRCWYRLPIGKFASETPAANPARAAALVTRVALEESIHRHLVSDVPVGIFLSGGIDSTVILALARQVLGPDADIRTFSIGFDDPELDESAIARRTAEHFGSRHTEWIMTPEEGAAEVSAFLGAIDQPGIDGFNTWCVSKLASRERMKVVLSGVGGDELFAGYSSFERVPAYRNYHRKLGPLRTLASSILDTKPAGSRWHRLAAFLRGEGEWLEAYHVQRGIFTEAEAGLLARHLAGEPATTFDWNSLELSDDPLDTVSLLEIKRYMRYQLLRDSDVYSMAHGLELRVPFVDSRFIESISGIAAAHRLRQGKLLLLDAVPEIPEWVRNQPKRGFRFPFQSWMEGSFGDLLAAADRGSPVVLREWYRTWAVAAAMKVIQGRADPARSAV
ncbi:MAG: asparagine synthase (glutamine-hydrolyzing) [Verrucomicrobiota bacterium]